MSLEKVLSDPESFFVIAIIELYNYLNRRGGLGYEAIKTILNDALRADLQSAKLTPDDVDELVSAVVISSLKPCLNENEHSIFFKLDESCTSSPEAFFYKIKDYIGKYTPSLSLSPHTSKYPPTDTVSHNSTSNRNVSTSVASVHNTEQVRGLVHQSQGSGKLRHSNYTL